MQEVYHWLRKRDRVLQYRYCQKKAA